MIKGIFENFHNLDAVLGRKVNERGDVLDIR